MLLISLAALATLGHGYLWMDLINPLHGWAGNRKIIDGLTILCILAFLILPLLILFHWNALDLANLSFSQSNFPWLRWLRGYFFLCVAWGVGRWALSFFHRRNSNNPKILLQHRQEVSQKVSDLVQQQSADVLHGAFPKLLAKIPGNQSLQVRVDHKRLAIPQLSEQHQGLTIAHLSDFHMTGRIGPAWFQAIAQQVNQLQPDLIAITGDILDKEVCWPWLADSLGKLRAPLGVYFIVGNHDYFIDVDHTRQLLQDQGLLCLSGTSLETDYNQAPILLLGNERPWNPTVPALPAPTSSATTDPQLRIALLHTPDQFSWACDQHAHLALAGHTHGGQIRFPLLGPVACPSIYGTRYACGLFRRQNTLLHVTRGLSGKTPLRWNCPPEIALLELVREKE